MASKPSTSANPCALEDTTHFTDELQLKGDELQEVQTQKAPCPHRGWQHMWEPADPDDLVEPADERCLQLSPSKL